MRAGRGRPGWRVLRWRIGVCAALIAAASALEAAEIDDAEILASAPVVSVYDGDTFTVEVAVWPGFRWKGSVRVDGVDTPELRGKCEEEKRLAKAARDFVQELALGTVVLLTDVGRDKYAGRGVAKVQLKDGRDLTELLIETGHGQPYDGMGVKPLWCPKE